MMRGAFPSVSLELHSTENKHEEIEQQVTQGLIVFVSNWLGFHTINNCHVVPAAVE